MLEASDIGSALGPVPNVPGAPGCDVENVVVRTPDGLRLCARWRRSPSPAAVVVVAHGFSASQDETGIDTLAVDLWRAGFDVLTYDARGHGGSEGLCGVGSTEHLDVAGATAAAATGGLPVVLLGVSMGGVAVVGHLVGDRSGSSGAAGAVLVSSPARWRMRPSAVGVLTAGLTRTSPGRWLAARRMQVRIAPRWRPGDPPESLVARIDQPLAIVHGTADRLLAVDHARRLGAAAAGPVRLDVVPGMGHGIDPASRHAALASVRWVLSARRATPTTTPGR